MVSIKSDSLIAPCGMNCGVCMAYLREKNKCLGCRAPNANKPITRVRCEIKTCKTIRNNMSGFCYECVDFPCENLIRLDKRYRAKYHMSMILNLVKIGKSGIKSFVKSEKVRWKCSFCSGTICVHKGSCHTCGK